MPSLNAMFKLMDGYSNTINIINIKTDEATNKILNASGATDSFNNKLKATGASADAASGGLGKFISVAKLIDIAVKGMSIIDEFTNTSARLGLITNSQQEQLELQEKIFDAAERSRGSYTAMANTISKLKMQAGNTFKSNDEALAFTELMQKSFKVGGASSSEQSSGMSQLTQAMTSGSLQGDEYRSIIDNNPLLAKSIEEYMRKVQGVKGTMKDWASEGLLTADVIKNAMFKAAGDINTKFDAMPMTFADVWNRIKNGGLEAFAPLIQATSRLINSDGFNTAVNIILTGINLITMGIGGMINFIADNWPIIQDILMATAIYLLATLGPAFIAAGIAGLQAGLTTAAGWIMANLPMLAIIATIAMIIYDLQKAGVTFEDIFGFIGGVVGVAIAGIYNLFLDLFDLVLGILNFLANKFVIFTNFFANVFQNPISSVIYLFQGMADAVLGEIEKIASAMDLVFGSKMADTVSNWRSGLKDMADAAVAEHAPNEDYQKLKKPVDLSASGFGFERMDYNDSWDTGSKIGKNVYGNLKGALSGLTSSFTNTGNSLDMSQFGTSNNPLKVDGTGSNGKVDVDMSDEDLKYLRDIAERDYINKFKTATLAPNIQVTFGDVHETADADAVAGRIKTILQEEIAMSAEGAY